MTSTRRYFYHVDLQGRLYLEETQPKDLTSCLKDPRFLRFFFRRLTLNNEAATQLKYPWISPCGPETNYVSAQDTGIVFTGLVGDQLVYGGESLSMPFDPHNLRRSDSGMFYHLISESLGGIGLLKSSIGLEFGDSLVANEDSGDVSLLWKGVLVPIQAINRAEFP